MIRCEYDKETRTLTGHLKGDSEILLFEFNCIANKLLEAFHKHGQEMLVLDEISDDISEFADKHISKTKGEQKDD